MLPSSKRRLALETLEPRYLLAVNPQGVTFQAVEGQSFSATVAIFISDDPQPQASSNYNATISWGDGNVSSASIVPDPTIAGAFDVVGANTFEEEGDYNGTVKINDVVDSTSSQVDISAVVADAPLIATSRIISPIEGKSISDIVASFIDTDPNGTASDYTATIDWGDGHTSFGTVTPAPGRGFLVNGTNTYAEQGSYPLSVVIEDVGGASETVNSTVFVDDAALLAVPTAIAAVEGTSLTDVSVATFTDAGGAGAGSDYSVTINWGDNTPLDTTSGEILFAGQNFLVDGSHTYAEAGVFTVRVAISEDTGASRAIEIVVDEANVADAPLSVSPVQPSVHTTEGVSFTGLVASFIDGNSEAPLDDFTATIDWGDGTPWVFGSITQPGGIGTPFLVSATHTYADSGVNGGIGNFTITARIVDTEGANLTLTNTVDVSDVAISVSGQLNASSDSGVSNADAITNINQPNFYGRSEPFSHVFLFANSVGGGSPIAIGQTQAGGDGSWNITSGPALLDGAYTITANAIDQFGKTTITIPSSPVVITPTLVIATQGPKVSRVFFDRLNGQIDVSYESNLAGVLDSTLIDATNYSFNKVLLAKQGGFLYKVTGVNVAPGGNSTTETVVITINGGHPIRGGFYDFVIHSAGLGGLVTGIQDRAGNALDGEFYGYFPSGNGVRGGDFHARLNAIHHLILPPESLVGRSTPISPPGTTPGTVIIHRHPAPVVHGRTTSIVASNRPLHRLAVHHNSLSHIASVNSKIS